MTVKTSNVVTATTVYVAIMTFDFVGLQQQLHMQKCNKHMKIWVFWNVTLRWGLCSAHNFKCTMFLWNNGKYFTPQHSTTPWRIWIVSNIAARTTHLADKQTSTCPIPSPLNDHFIRKCRILYRQSYCRTCKHTYCNAGKSVCLCIRQHTKCTSRLLPCYSCAYSYTDIRGDEW